MESQPQNPEFRINSENFHPCIQYRQAHEIQWIDYKNLPMVHECEGGTEKSILMITVWHHKACRVMPNGDPKGRIFLSHPHTNTIILDFFLVHHSMPHFYLIFLKINSQKFLNMLR